MKLYLTLVECVLFEKLFIDVVSTRTLSVSTLVVWKLNMVKKGFGVVGLDEVVVAVVVVVVDDVVVIKICLVFCDSISFLPEVIL